MKVNELRVGNYIFEPKNENKNPFKIFSIYHEDKNEKINGYPINYFYPIKLTEEWLLRFGFKKNQLGSVYENMVDFFKEGCICEIKFDYNTKTFFLTFANNAVGVEIKNVHNLQNLFIDIEGKELEMK